MLAHAFPFPELSPQLQALVRTGYGLLLLVMLADLCRHGRRFFLSERWGGYGQSSWSVDSLQNPLAYPLVMVAWLTAATALVAGWWTVGAALANLLFCRYYFVQMRWKGVSRGLGAPGFMTYWLGAAVFLLEFCTHFAPALQGTALLVLQVDFACIMLSAGIYKFTAGYPRNHGMELGMANPQWGYWHRAFARVPPSHWIFKTLNHLAWSLEIVAAALMLVPATRAWGAAIVIASFLFIATQIRLGTLCQIVIVSSLLFFAPNTLGGQLLERVVPAWLVPHAMPTTSSCLPLTAGLWAYLLLLPLAHAGLFYNFYGRKRLPGLLQHCLERYTNFFGIIIWRVFSADHTNFCIMVHRQPGDARGGHGRQLVSDYSRWGGRFSHVGEAITLTTLFTTLKYYPSNSGLFRERLLRYARTIACPAGWLLVFEYLQVCKTARGFELLPAAEYHVLPDGSITEIRLSDELSVRQAHAASPVHEGVRPGSYVALGT